MAFVGTQHPKRHLSQREFINKVIIKTIFFARPRDDLAIHFPSLDVLTFPQGRSLDPPLVPRSHKSQGCFSSSFSQTKITPFEGDYQQSASPAKATHDHGGSPMWLTGFRIDHRQGIHISPHRRRTLQTSTFGLAQALQSQVHPSQASITCMASSSFDPMPGTPVIPKEAY
jgi:hypothetical protein